MSTKTFTNIYLYLDDDFRVSWHGDATWMVNFGIDCVTMDVFYLHSDVPDPELMDTLTLSEPVSDISQVIEAVREHMSMV